MTENEIGKIVVDCAVRLHIELGPGLFPVDSWQNVTEGKGQEAIVDS